MTKPTTEAGKRLVRFAQNMTEAEMLAEVAAIETEAVNAVLDRLAAEVRAMGTTKLDRRDLPPRFVYRSAVLAAIEKEQRLLAHLAECDTCRPFGWHINARNAIATVEDEAVKAALDRLVQRIHDDVGSDIEGLARDSEKALHCAWPTITLRILAAIEEARR